MTNTTAANGKEAAYFGVPWEDAYGYAQAIKIGNTIHVSGQLSHDENGTLIAPAALGDSGKPADFSTKGAQKIGRESGGERVCQIVEHAEAAGTLKKKNQQEKT